MSQHKHIHPAPVSAGRQIATALALAGLAAFSLPAIAADHYVSINDGNVHRNNYDNDGATGGNSVAIGVSAAASGLGASAMGASASATGGSSISVGTFTQATGNASTAIGERATATENAATALGRHSTASGGASTAIGSGAQASAQNATALGGGASASGNTSIAIGTQSSASEGQSVAIGRHAVADTSDSVALGSYSKTATAVGTSSATVNGVTYGGFAGTAPVGTVSVGDTGAERTVTNVAAGRITSTSTDAINGSQLYQVASQANGNTTQINNINNRIGDMDKDLRAGIAGATAIAFLQRPNEAGKSMVSAAAGGYRGEQALALGYATNSDNNKWSTKVGLGIDTQKNINWGGSVGYQW
ncbi:YadA family autotransporter adhesin [Uruburuella suis]|uniref:YadA family autotransporter adhesin n=1 Tax=Uruburuella suis TaxID=252130 RepID=UPI0024911305|nr:YadA-like family protein [Uruburuella suis]